MRNFKSQVLLRLVNSYVIDSPQPANISYLWNFGSLLGTCLILQILTGIFLAMHYQPHVDFAFNSVEHIMRDVNNGWAVRYTHANVASFFFIFVYAHIARGLYYGSYKSPRVLVWAIGVIILIVMMATAFLGYSHSPKWFNLTLYTEIFIIIIFNSFLVRIKTNIPIYNSHPLKEGGLPVNSNSFNYIQKRYKSTFSNINNLLDKFIKENKLEPVFRYNNLDLDESKKLIQNETKGLSGIYLIFNNITGDYYIGSASTNKFYSRFYRHLIALSGSKILKIAVRKYKLSNFSFLLLELFPEIVNKENNKMLLDLEDFYLKTLLPNYNILTEAGSSFGYKHTELSRIKMKTNYSNERKEFIGNLNRNKNLSPETIEKMRESALNRGKINYSEEAILNMKKNSKSLILYNLDKTVFGFYSSIVEAAKSINCSEKTITRALKTQKRLLKRRFIVEYNTK